MSFEGFHPLNSTADLLEKVRHDFSRMQRDPLDSYAAFDFFVTAEHLLDWKYPDSEGRGAQRTRSHLRKTVPLLRVTSHLATGAKHVSPNAERHDSVQDVRIEPGAFDPRAFDPVAFDTDRLVVELRADDASELGPEVWALDLAEKVLLYWEANL